MYRKVKKINIIFITLILSLASCKQSYFQMLTHSDIGFWRTQGFYLYHSYSKTDSTFKDYDEKMEQFRDQWVWLEYLCEHKFRISNDTLYRYHRDKKTGICYPDFTYQIVSLKKNRLRMKRIPSEHEKIDSIPEERYYVTFFRVKSRDIKRIKEGGKVKFKDCKNTFDIEIDWYNGENGDDTKLNYDENEKPGTKGFKYE